MAGVVPCQSYTSRCALSSSRVRVERQMLARDSCDHCIAQAGRESLRNNGDSLQLRLSEQTAK